MIPVDEGSGGHGRLQVACRRGGAHNERASERGEATREDRLKSSGRCNKTGRVRLRPGSHWQQRRRPAESEACASPRDPRLDLWIQSRSGRRSAFPSLGSRPRTIHSPTTCNPSLGCLKAKPVPERSRGIPTDANSSAWPILMSLVRHIFKREMDVSTRSETIRRPMTLNVNSSHVLTLLRPDVGLDRKQEKHRPQHAHTQTQTLLSSLRCSSLFTSAAADHGGRGSHPTNTALHFARSQA